MLNIEQELIKYTKSINRNKCQIFPYTVDYKRVSGNIKVKLGYDPAFPEYLFLINNSFNGIRSSELLKLTKDYICTYAISLYTFEQGMYTGIGVITNIKHDPIVYKKIKIL